MFVYEHFPNIAPTPNVFAEFREDSYEKDLSGEYILNKLGECIPRQPRTSLWSNTRGCGNFGLVVDKENEFCFRTYLVNRVGSNTIIISV